MNFNGFLAHLDEALSNEDGVKLSYLLRPSSPHGKELLKDIRNPTMQGLARFKGKIESPWDEIAIHYVLIVNHLAKDEPVEAFKGQCTLVSLFYRSFVTKGGWMLLALFAILRDLRDLSFQADRHDPDDDKTESSEEAARVVSQALGHCMTDRISTYDASRKWGIYYVVGLVLKCYFRIQKISLSKSILRALDGNTDRPPLSAYPQAHQVTYRYYLGMIAFLNEDHGKAENELTLAFYHCHIGSKANQERILSYLVPLRMLRGHLPGADMLQDFPGLQQLFTPFATAIRKGDLRAYDQALEDSEARLFDLNLWFTLERARELCMRSLFRRAWIATDRVSRMPIATFHAALRVSGLVDIEREEAECFVANMIYKGFMKGYISHEQQLVVLSKNNAFPRVADRQSPFAFLS